MISVSNSAQVRYWHKADKSADECPLVIDVLEVNPRARPGADVRFGSKADLIATKANVGFVPEADIIGAPAFTLS